MQTEGIHKEIEAEKWRQKPPNFDIDVDSTTKFYIIFHLSWFLIILFIVLAGLPGIVSNIQTWREGVAALVFFCMFLLYPLFMVLLFFRGIADRVPMLIKKIKWIKDSASSQATIVDRGETVHHTESDEYNTWNIIYAYKLRLRYVPTKAIINSSELTVWASVDQRIYKKYERREVARIYYSLANPSIFFIKHE